MATKLIQKVSKPEVKENLRMLLVKLAVRYEDWCVGALNVEYFVKKIQAWTEDVQTICN